MSSRVGIVKWVHGTTSEEGEEDLPGVGVFFYPSPPRRERDREGRHIILSRPHRIQNLPIGRMWEVQDRTQVSRGWKIV